MKSIVRTIVFVVISLNFSQYILKAFNYGPDPIRTMVLVVLTLSLLYFLLRPVLKIVLMPSEGFGYIFLLFALTFAVLFVLTLFLPYFSIKATSVSGLIIFGYVIPSKDLTSLWAAVCSALLVSTVYNFLQSLCSKK